MKKLLNRVALIILFIFTFITIDLSLQAQNTVIKAGHLFDPRTGKFSDNQIIIIKNGRILQIGSNLAYEKNDKVIDLSKSWVLPGLMDCHVHITSPRQHIDSICINKASIIITYIDHHSFPGMVFCIHVKI